MKRELVKLKTLTTRITKGTTPTTMGFDFVDYGINFIYAKEKIYTLKTWIGDYHYVCKLS